MKRWSNRRGAETNDPGLDDLLEVGRPDDVEVLARLHRRSTNELPSPAARNRLLAALRTTHRFDDLEADVARLLDLPAERAAELLLAVDEPTSWESGPAPGCELLHVQGGPKVTDAITGFVRVEAGSHFPHHEHIGDEVVLVLQGAFRSSGGAVVRAGEVSTMPAGSAHSLQAIGDLPLMYLAIVQRGVVLGGQTVLPGDPRA